MTRPAEHRITITSEGVEIQAGSDDGAFAAVQTLRLLTNDDATLPCCLIHDWADLPIRGLLHDITRGKVPTLDTLQSLVDRLTGWKINQLQLYIEHAFAFTFDPDICAPGEGLTPDEVRELDKYCRERFIDLVPAVATFGHMGRILSMPKYRALAEVEAVKSWHDMPWPERLRGFTLDCLNPSAHALAERMWTDILDAFSSPIVNICGDEPWDLGQGKNRERLVGDAKGVAYLDQIRRIQSYCEARGRRVQFWSDVVTHYPDLYDRIPKGATVLHWGYDDRADYEGTRKFVDAGLPTIVCPGVSGWKRTLNGMTTAERNIAAFAEAARRCGAVGLLNTDWGDHGHFNLLGCSMHGIALGAALAWDVHHPTGAAFDERLSVATSLAADSGPVSQLREAARLGDLCESWRLMWQPLARNIEEKDLPGETRLHEVIEASRRARESWRSLSPAAGDDHDPADVSTATRFNELAAEKLLFVHALRDNRIERVRGAMADWCERVREAAPEYEARWLARNKPAGLDDIRAALRATVADVHAWAKAAP